MHFLQTTEHLVRFYAHVLPLELFVILGSFLEEVISPIPSALIMGTAGTLSLVRHEPLWYLFWLAFIGNFGKIAGAYVYYFIGDKLEDVLVKRFSKYFGIQHEEIENIGKRFVGHHWKDGGVLLLLRLVPFFPTTPVSITAGVIKMDLFVFLVATYLGNFFKDLVYLYVGYAGIARLHDLWRTMSTVKFEIDVALVILFVTLMTFLYIHRGKGKKFLQHCDHLICKWLKLKQ